jgi:hypothetical protein
MNCKHTWSIDFLCDAFSKTYVNTRLKVQRENVLFEREKGLMPATQSYVEWFLRDKDLGQKIKTLSKQRSELKAEMADIHTSLEQRYEIWLRLANVRSAIKKLIEEKQTYDNMAVKAVAEKRQFVRQCPTAECKGFLSTQWKCGICSVWVCSDCHEIKGDTRDAFHICKPENVETAKLITRESKPCPNCSIPICKISGCSQMFCTSCHTPWDWNTGIIVKSGRIHNPHYYEMMRDNGTQMREHGDVPCGGFPGTRTFYHKLRSIVGDNIAFSYTNKLTAIIHMWDVVAARLQPNLVMDNLDLRAQYMMNDINEAKFKQRLQQREKASRRNTEYYAILTVLRDVSLGIINEMLEADTHDKLMDLDENLLQIWLEADENLGNVARKYNCKQPELHADMMMLAY